MFAHVTRHQRAKKYQRNLKLQKFFNSVESASLSRCRRQLKLKMGDLNKFWILESLAFLKSFREFWEKKFPPFPRERLFGPSWRPRNSSSRCWKKTLERTNVFRPVDTYVVRWVGTKVWSDLAKFRHSRTMLKNLGHFEWIIKYLAKFLACFGIFKIELGKLSFLKMAKY